MFANNYLKRTYKIQKLHFNEKTMNRKTLIAFVLFLCLNCFAQNNFAPGYYIDNSNKKTECLIRDMNWKNNPKSITIKAENKIETTILNIESVKEFGVYGNSKYVRSLVKIDRSSEMANELDNQRMPNFNEELLLLKVLIEGKVNLFLYEDGNLRRFFFQNENQPIEQLIFKTFLVNPNLAKKNNQFKQQLSNALKSESLDNEMFEKLQYRENQLTDLLILFHEKENLQFKRYLQKRSANFFNINVRPRIVTSSLSFNNTSSSIYYMNYDNQINLSLGVEFEVVLPFNNNKWSIFLEPTYQSFSDEKIQNPQSGSSPEIKHTVKYSSIDFHLGLRYYSFLNEDSKLFFNLAAVPNYVMDGKYEIINSTSFYSNTVYSFDLSITFNASIGIGYKFMDRYSVEFRYNTPRGLTDNYVVWDTRFNSSSLIFGYTIF
jgi:hypothetical protein